MYPYRDLYPISSCRVILKNMELWTKFHELETEMIITKSGRRMFPSIQVQISELDPNAHYCVYLDMVPASKCRYKYGTNSGWTPAGTEESQYPSRMYVHPESPSTGEQWMSQPISFGRVKLTNTLNPPVGHIVLSSMHKYQPKIIVVKTSDPRNIPWAPSTSFTFPETLFIAVTAYQNEKITKLKIDHNPFAKGFRENGQSKCKKRKIENEVIDILSTENESAKFELHSAKKMHVCSRHDCDSPKSINSATPPRMEMMALPPPPPPQFQVFPNAYHPPAYNFPFQYWPTAAFYYPPMYTNHAIGNSLTSFVSPNLSPRDEEAEELPKPRKLTDFSIRAITGQS